MAKATTILFNNDLTMLCRYYFHTGTEASVYFLMVVIIFDMEVVIRKFTSVGFVFEFSKTGI